jgi:hypothetical protein
MKDKPFYDSIRQVNFGGHECETRYACDLDTGICLGYYVNHAAIFAD